MKLLPFDRFEVETTLSLDEVVSNLEAYVEPPRFFSGFSDHPKFQGRLSRGGFRITRVVYYAASVPVFTGRFLPGPTGTRVQIWVNPPLLVLAFMFVWFGVVGIAMILILLSSTSGQVPAVMMLGLLAMIVLGWAFISGGFWIEVGEQKKMLIEILNGIEVD